MKSEAIFPAWSDLIRIHSTMISDRPTTRFIQQQGQQHISSCREGQTEQSDLKTIR